MIAVILEDEHGQHEAVLDKVFGLDHLLPDARDPSWSCLRFIDPYGDTDFNGLQCRVLVQELDRLAIGLEGSDADLIRKIQDLARRCADGIGLFIRFYGD